MNTGKLANKRICDFLSTVGVGPDSVIEMLYREMCCQHRTQVWGVREGFQEAVTSNWDCKGDWELATGGGHRECQAAGAADANTWGTERVHSMFGESGKMCQCLRIKAVGRVQRDEEEIDRDRIMERPGETWEGFKQRNTWSALCF